MNIAIIRRCAVCLAAVAGAACSSAVGGASANGSVDSSIPAFNGCTPEMFVTGTSATTVSFGGQASSPLFGYAPKCVRITAGESVTFTGDFSVHPVSPGTSPTATTAGSASNPIPLQQTGSSLSVTFPEAGTYPYFCQVHYAAGMSGVVLVQ